MARRKSRKKSPNIPQDVLEQARQENGDVAEDENAQSEETATENEAVVAVERRSRRRRRRSSQPSAARKAERDLRRKKKGELSQEQIAYLLSHPTKEVDENELRDQYGYVVKDLRNMGLLAAALIVVLIVAALVFV
ncbi:MAG: hypothetical protein D6712_17245 [Chloroflexi bacterium]|nr:MAG: hypothetical protein D6712_17245 [Chloroflexota bacterium]